MCSPGAYVTDQGLIQSDAARLLRYRKALGASNVSILADVHVKHATPLAPVPLEDAVVDTVKRGGADGIIISGSGTGSPTAMADLETASRVSSAPLYVGSGVTLESVKTLRSQVDGVIVGTAFKEGGVVSAPVDEARVRVIVEAWRSTQS